MGATHVTVTIRNPAEPDRTWEALFLVDTGATDCLVPRPFLDGIGLQPRGQRVYELADGSEIKVDITVAEIEFMGEIVGGTIIFGGAGGRTAARRYRLGIRRHRGRSRQPAPEATACRAPQEQLRT